MRKTDIVFMCIALGALFVQTAQAATDYTDSFDSAPFSDFPTSFTTGTTGLGLSYVGSNCDFSYGSAQIYGLAISFPDAASITITARDGKSFYFNSMWIDTIEDITIKGSGAEPFTINVSGGSIGTYNPTGGAKMVTQVVVANVSPYPDFNIFFDNVSTRLGLANITFTDGSGFTPNITRGNSNEVLGRFQLAGDVSGASLTAASIRLNGTRTGLSNLKLWSSADASFGGDTQLGSAVTADPGDGNSVTFSSFSSSIATGGRYYFLTGDAAGGASGSVMGIILQNSSLTLSDGILSGMITNAPLSNGDASLPVELLSFSARTEGHAVILNWITEGETDNLGFILERAGNTDWTQIASYQTHNELKGQGNTSSRTEYTFTDQTLESGKEYAYRLSDVSTRGEITVYAALSVQMDVLPGKTEMKNACPNPFNPHTLISYRLSEDTQIEISVFDLTGRHVKTLYSSHQSAGNYHVYWNSTDVKGMKVPGGCYIIQMKTEKARQTQKVLLMK